MGKYRFISDFSKNGFYGRLEYKLRCSELRSKKWVEYIEIVNVDYVFSKFFWVGKEWYKGEVGEDVLFWEVVRSWVFWEGDSGEGDVGKRGLIGRIRFWMNLVGCSDWR